MVKEIEAEILIEQIGNFVLNRFSPYLKRKKLICENGVLHQNW